MPHPPFVVYDTTEEYREHYEDKYCRGSILTSDEIPVYFKKGQFEHCFFESSQRNGIKDEFSPERAKRIDWIEGTLTSPEATLYQGWISRDRTYDSTRRVAVVYGDFVVVIAISISRQNTPKAKFLTCYDADNSIDKIRQSPIWTAEDCLAALLD